MYLPRAVWCLILFIAVPFPLDGQEGDLKAALALERSVQKAIARAEPAVACVLVSRTELYQKFGQDPAEAAKGKLGGFNPGVLPPLMGLKKLDPDPLRDRLDMASARHVPEAFGSGVVIDPRGLILTNYHVIRDATKIYVRLPGRKGSYADIHAADARSDLAVLRLLDRADAPLPVLKLGDAAKLNRGQFLLTLSNPFAAGFRDGQPTASFGILGNVRRRALGMRKEEEKSLHLYGSLLQVDARVSLGSSGGALLDLEGNLVGLLSAWAGVVGGDAPGGFAIPIDSRFRRIVEVLAKGEEVEYGFLGIGLTEGVEEEEGGVSVGSVYLGSAAYRAGMRKGDRIVAVDGERIDNSDDLFLLLGGHLAGSRVQIEYVRPGMGKKAGAAVLGKLLAPGKRIYSSLGARPFVMGLRVDETSILVQQVPRWLNIPAGVVVADLEEGSPAVRAKLNPGDVITHVDGEKVHSPAEFYRVMEGKKGPVEFTLHPPGMGGEGLKVIVK